MWSHHEMIQHVMKIMTVVNGSITPKHLEACHKMIVNFELLHKAKAKSNAMIIDSYTLSLRYFLRLQSKNLSL